MIAVTGGRVMGWMWVWPALVVFGLLVIGYVVVRLVQSGRGASQARSGHGSAARQILDERYARGEIDEQEYRHRRDLLP